MLGQVLHAKHEGAAGAVGGDRWLAKARRNPNLGVGHRVGLSAPAGVLPDSLHAAHDNEIFTANIRTQLNDNTRAGDHPLPLLRLVID